jgi:hypothetical protein
VERPESLETALDEALDALVAGDPEAARRVKQRYRHAPEVAGLMDAAGRVRTALAAKPSPQAQARHLAMIREAAGRLAPDASRRRFAFQRPRFVQKFLLRPAFVIGLALVLVAPAALALSARALPGDPLYSTKLAVEHVRLAMARDPAKQVGLHVEFSQRRVSELAQITDRGLPDQAAIGPVLTSLQAHQHEAVEGVDSLKQEGKPVGVLGERVAVALQQNTARLVEIRSDTGCNPDGSDPRCQVIAIAVTGSEQALRQFGEAPTPGAPGDQGALASPPSTRPGSPRGGDRGQAPTGPGTGQQPGSAPSSGAPGTEPGPGTGGNQPGGATEPSTPPSSAAPGQGPSVPAPVIGGVHPSPGPSGGQGGSPGGPSSTAELPIMIDIKPFDDTNTIDPVNRRDLPVVVKASPDFDPSTLEIRSICFGHDPTDPAKSDCSAQGRAFPLPGIDSKDLILVFNMSKTGIRAGDTEACLIGHTKDGRTVKGCDKVSVVAVTPSSAPPAVGNPPTSPGTGGIGPGRFGPGRFTGR